MKFVYSILSAALFFVGCQPQADNSAQMAFEKNSETVLANLQGFQNENLDYSQYAEDFVMRDTGFGNKDSLSLDEMIAFDKEMLEAYDFKILTDPIVLLPGVNPDTRKPDGSVRHYTDWEVTLPATDSTEARSGVIKLYESFDFNAEGKITFQQVYGDFTGIMMHLHGGGEEEMMAPEE